MGQRLTEWHLKSRGNHHRVTSKSFQDYSVDTKLMLDWENGVLRLVLSFTSNMMKMVSSSPRKQSPTR
jgi:hypothetical protein